MELLELLKQLKETDEAKALLDFLKIQGKAFLEFIQEDE